MRQGFIWGLPLLMIMVLGTTRPLYGQARDVEERLAELERQVEQLLERLNERASADLEALRRQIEAITREIEELKLGREVTVQADTSLFGFGPGASKVYRASPGVSIGGYGELLYENFADEREDNTPSQATAQLDALRAIVYVGYKFSDGVVFNSEVEFEHASTGQTGSVSLEFAYLDWLVSESFGVRAGLLLLPMGFINELHEPTTFLGTERPETERRIIPSTWRENGLGVFGEVAGLGYRAYVVNGFDGVGGGTSDAGGFSAAGLRDGRQKGSRAVAEDFAGVVRVDYQGRPGLVLGMSAYLGESGQNAESPVDGGSIGATTLVWEGHAEYRARGLDLRGLVAVATLGDVDELNAARGLTGTESIGERLVGWYVQAGYDVLHRAQTLHRIIPYARYEELNTQDAVPAGFAADPRNDRRIVSLGLAWKPLTNLVVKADYQIHSNEADTGVDQFNVALGYLF